MVQGWIEVEPGSAAGVVAVLLCYLASLWVNPGSMFPGEAGLRRVRAVWGLRPGRRCLAGGDVLEPRVGAAPRLGRG